MLPPPPADVPAASPDRSVFPDRNIFAITDAIVFNWGTPQMVNLWLTNRKSRGSFLRALSADLLLRSRLQKQRALPNGRPR